MGGLEKAEHEQREAGGAHDHAEEPQRLAPGEPGDRGQRERDFHLGLEAAGADLDLGRVHRPRGGAVATGGAGLDAA
jgi:hypothetical protein